jgi:hypothetical protein
MVVSGITIYGSFLANYRLAILGLSSTLLLTTEFNEGRNANG